MKLLLTSGGVTNPSIHSALVQLLGKPISECHALCVRPVSAAALRLGANPDLTHLEAEPWAGAIRAVQL